MGLCIPVEDALIILGLQDTSAVKYRQRLPKIQWGEAQDPHIGSQWSPRGRRCSRPVWHQRNLAADAGVTWGGRRLQPHSGNYPTQWGPWGSRHPSWGTSARPGTPGALPPYPKIPPARAVQSYRALLTPLRNGWVNSSWGPFPRGTQTIIYNYLLCSNVSHFCSTICSQVTPGISLVFQSPATASVIIMAKELRLSRNHLMFVISVH